MKNLIATLHLFLLAFVAQAQLNPGDIAFLGMQTDNPDAFAFVTLVDINPNTQISFTDNAWNGSALLSNENTLTWTSPATVVPIGTVVVIHIDPALSSTVLVDGPGTTVGALNGLAVAGDQILAYTGASTSPSFIAAISTNQFLAACDVGADNNNTCLPAPLVEGINAIAVPGSATEADNIFVDFVDFTGSADDIRAIIMDPENWTYDDDPALAGYDIWPDWQFGFSTPDPSEINFQTGFFSLLEGATPSIITLSISPASFGSQSVVISLSGNATTDDLISSPAFEGTDLTFNIPSGTTSFDFNLAAFADLISEGTETGTLTISSTTSGLTIGQGAILNFEITEPEGISFVSFGQSTYNANEADGSIDVTMTISPAPTEAASFTLYLTETSLSGADYTSTPAADQGAIFVDLIAGQSSFVVTVNLINDTEIEGVETLEFSFDELSPGLQNGLITSAVLSVSDNDGVVVSGGLYINEVMASNTSTIADDSGDFDDWIEIYNDSFLAQDLAGLYITDEQGNPSKYQFPSGSNSTQIPSAGFVLVWADNTPSQGAMHTNFTLSASGEYVGLYASNGDLLDEITFPTIGANESYGRETEGSTTWLTFTEGATTPNQSNSLSGIRVDLQSQTQVFPSPAQQLITVQIPAQTQDLTIHVFDTQGRLMHSGTIQSGALTYQLECATWPAANYLIRIGNQKTKAYQRISVIH